LIQGEIVKAIVLLKPGTTATERELIHHAKKVMSLYKIPRIVEILSDDSLKNAAQSDEKH